MGANDRDITVRYTNWRGETDIRRIVPRKVWWGITDWHPRYQWLMTAYDLDKCADRDFALDEMDFTTIEPQPTDAQGGM